MRTPLACGAVALVPPLVSLLLTATAGRARNAAPAPRDLRQDIDDIFTGRLPEPDGGPLPFIPAQRTRR